MNYKPKILMLLSNGLSPDPRVFKEAKTLVQNNYDVTIYCLDRNCNLPETEVIDGIKIKRFRVGIVTPSSVLKTPIALWKFKGLINKETKNKSFDIVHAHDFDTASWGYFLAKKLKSKFVFDCHDLYFTQLPKGNFVLRILRNTIKRLELLAAKKADLLITVTENIGFKENGLKEYFIDNNITSDNIFVLWNYPTKLKKYEKTPNDKTIISFIGSVRDVIGFENFLKIIKNNNSYEINIYGWGHKMEDLKVLATKYNVSLKILGTLPYTEIGKAYAKSDIIFSIYDANRENIKRAIAVKSFEANYFNVPVLANKHTLNGEFVEKNNIGFAVETTQDYLDALKVIKTKKLKFTTKEFLWSNQENDFIATYNKTVY